MLAKQSPEWRQWRLDHAGILFYVARPEIVVIGLGYVGLPVAATFARAGGPVIGFDIDPERARELPAGRDRTLEVDATDLRLAPLNLTCDIAGLRPADFFIVTMPTSIDTANRPDLSAIFDAWRIVGTALKKGDIVVYESTVYPGAVEENCVPILERDPGLKADRFQCRLFARARHFRRQEASLRDYHLQKAV
jgi:UDP-N-acetyl-D-galactosamine dehydrogenase